MTRYAPQAEKTFLRSDGGFRGIIGPNPTPTHPGFYQDARALAPRLAGPIPIRCPVRLLHGQADPDVPWRLALDIAERVRSGDVQVTLIKDGDHRLSREEDIALLQIGE